MKTDSLFTVADSESLGNSSDSSRKQIFWGILGIFFCSLSWKCMFILESPQVGNSDEYTQHAIKSVDLNVFWEAD